jgi:hypothetical protein
MSDEPFDHPSSSSFSLGEAERRLLERKRAQDLGLVQELGRTIKKDGLDGIRAVVWSLYHASNVVFPMLFVGMMAGLCLNMAGYGYYWSDDGRIVLDTLDHIRQNNMWMQFVE